MQDEKDIEKLILEANQGSAQAQFNLGVMYYNGDGIRQDSKKAFDLYQKAANQNHSRSQYHLANMYYNGIGT